MPVSCFGFVFDSTKTIAAMKAINKKTGTKNNAG
jgi:hypothetical protein